MNINISLFDGEEKIWYNYKNDKWEYKYGKESIIYRA